MKRTTLLASLIVFVGMATAVVGGPEAPENGVAITSSTGGSTSAGASVTENGTEYRKQLSVTNGSCMSSNASRGLEFETSDASDELNTVEFSGTVQTDTPCTQLSLNVEESGDLYTLSFDRSSPEGVCEQCVGMKNVQGSFSASGGYQVEFMNEKETVYSHEFGGEKIGSGDGEENSSKEKPTEEPEGGFGFNELMADIIGFFTGLGPL